VTIRYVENATGLWAPFPDIQLGAVHPAWAGREPGTGQPPRRRPQDPRPPRHELRPFERYYWVEGDLPAPPPPQDPRWDKVRLFLLNTVNWDQPVEHRLKVFTEDVWRAKSAPEDQMSIGSWQDGFNDNYWQPAWAEECPPFRRVGWEPWANGHAAGNHYRTLTWCLEDYTRTGNPLSWQQFVVGTLHLAGQGCNGSVGSLYNEKSPWWIAGDYTVGGTTTPWSHRWGECIYLLTLLTGELADRSLKCMEWAWYQPAYYTGYWGVRSCVWYISELLAADMLLPAYVTIDDERAFDVIDRALFQVEARGNTWFHNDGAYDGTIDVWQDWLFLAKAMQWAITKGRAEMFYPRLKPIADWHLANNRTASGQIAYYRTDQGPVYTSHTHTSCALPFMAEMVRRGDLPRQELWKSCEFVLENLPYTLDPRPDVYGKHLTGRGILWQRRPADPNDEGTRPWGSAASKIAAATMEGLRGDVLKVAGY
jgi:hypothetical protein